MLTTSQINRIGEKLRKTRPPDLPVLEELQAFRDMYDGALTRAHALVAASLRIEPTSRIKTVNTIVEKLVRSKTRLSTMQDIAGVRVVLGEDADLRDQAEAVDRLREVFTVVRVDDLTKGPRYGYRATHVIVEIDGLAVEIQVRTKLQDLWAQGMEKLADRVGRGIRYGEAPALKTFGSVSVDLLVRYGMEWSGLVQGNEEAVVAIRDLEDDISVARIELERADASVLHAEESLNNQPTDGPQRAELESILLQMLRARDEHRDDLQYHVSRARDLKAGREQGATAVRRGLASFDKIIEDLSKP